MNLIRIATTFIYTLAFTTQLLAQAPPGYYGSASGLSGGELKTALYHIVKNHTVVSGTAIWNHFGNTDAKANGKVWDMYSDNPYGSPPYEYIFISDQCGNPSNEGDCYNREHSFPQSWYADASPMSTDLHHIYPTDGFVNGMRANYPFGDVNNTSWTSMNGSKRGSNSDPGYNDIVFEPIDAYKGDFARTHFYMATRYENLIAGWKTNSPQANGVLDGNSYPAFKTWYVELLVSWHLSDPVSAKEIARNNAVYTIQGNRNPFIDEPAYVQLVWGGGFETEPLNHVSDFTAQRITLNWTDAAGPTQPDGYLVRMNNIGFEYISLPENGQPVADDFWNMHVGFGEQSCTFGSLNPGTTYFFKVFSFRGSGAGIIYKTDGIIPQINIETN
jgi:endonuclease I